jgi:hypothetical protein
MFDKVLVFGVIHEKCGVDRADGGLPGRLYAIYGAYNFKNSK